MSRSLFGPGTIILGGGSILLMLVLAVGFFLPKEWTASAEVTADVLPPELIRYLDSPEGWRLWTAWPDSGLVRSGPDRGSGASISWTDAELGAGSFTIRKASEDEILYDVVVDGAANTLMTTTGTLILDVTGTSTVLQWTESGDLGQSPLMGFWALTMERAQTRELQKSLSQLIDVLSSGSEPNQ